MQQADLDKTSGFTQKTFSVSPSTNKLAIAFQDVRAGTNNFYSPSKFTINERHNVDDYIDSGDAYFDDLNTLNLERFVKRLYVSYAGQNRPSPDLDQEYDVADIDIPVLRLQEAWQNTMLDSGSYFYSGGPENFVRYLDMGPVYMYDCEKAGNDRSTNVSVHFEFGKDMGVKALGDGDTTSSKTTGVAKVLLFDIFTKVAAISVENGIISDVQVQAV